MDIQIPMDRQKSFNNMKKFFKRIIYLTTSIFTIVGVCYTIFHKDKTSLDIEKVSTILLNDSLNIKGLEVHYTYNDSINLSQIWQTTYVIRNTGDKTILGEGFADKNIRSNHIPIIIENCNLLLAIDISNTNCDSAFIMNNHLYFKQWRPNEFIEITIISEGSNSTDLKISDREIADSEITYSEYYPKIDNSKDKLIDYLPNVLAYILKWSFAIFYIITLIACIVEIVKKCRSISNNNTKILFIIACIIIIIIYTSPILWIF